MIVNIPMECIFCGKPVNIEASFEPHKEVDFESQDMTMTDEARAEVRAMLERSSADLTQIELEAAEGDVKPHNCEVDGCRLIPAEREVSAC